MKKILFFFFIIFSSFNVFAKTNDVSNKIKFSRDGTSGTYIGEEIYLGGGSNSYYTVGTRYNGRLSLIEFYLSSDDWDWNYNKTYTVTLNMATSDWRNHFMGPQVFMASNSGNDSTSYGNLFVNNSFRFVSMKKISFQIKLKSTMLSYLHFRVYSTNTVSTPFTGDNNWNLSSITISDVTSSTPTPVPVTPIPSTPTPTPLPNNQDIINNANQNTQDVINNQNNNTESVINNQNQNTTDLIENQNQNANDQIENSNQNTESVINNANQNTRDLIESQRQGFSTIAETLGSCYFNLFDIHAYNNEKSPQLELADDLNGFRVWCREYAVNSQIKLKDYCPKCQVGKTYYLGGTSSSINAMYIYPGVIWSFGTTKTITQSMLDSNVTFYGQQNTPSCVGKIQIKDIAIYEGTSNKEYTPFGLAKCSSKLDETNQVLNDTNQYLKDNSDPYIADNDFLTMFNSIGFNDPLQHLLQLPVQFINALVSQSNTCQAVNLGTLWGVSLSLPCINLQNILGSGVWTTIDILMSIGLLVVIVKNLYETFANLLTMGGEKQAREKFNLPTPMEFLSMILGGDR